MAQELKADETLDTLRCGGVQIIQHRRGYRFSIDPVLLAHFVTLQAGDRIADLGCGSGVVGLLLAQRLADVTVLGVELQPQQVCRAQRSVRLNRLEQRVEIIEGDVRSLDPALHGSFERVVSNPPFRPLANGRCSHGDERAAARHELAGGIDEFVAAAARLLRHGGTLAMIHLAERVVDICTAMRAARLEPKRIRYIHSRCGSEARLVMIEGRKNGKPGLQTEAPLFLYRSGQRLQAERGQRDRYSAEVERLFEGDGG